MKNAIFVFGSNEAGIHGAGAARTAHEKYGAILGIGYGLTGASFAIPTKDRNIQTITDHLRIDEYIVGFKAFAKGRDDLLFKVTRIGCGLAGFKDEDIAPFFIGSPDNCYFDTVWKPILGDDYNYWGTW